VHEGCVAAPDVRVVEGRGVDGGGAGLFFGVSIVRVGFALGDGEEGDEAVVFGVRRRTSGMSSSRMYLSASAHASPCRITS
jgi:hypothetical protein